MTERKLIPCEFDFLRNGMKEHHSYCHEPDCRYYQDPLFLGHNPRSNGTFAHQFSPDADAERIRVDTIIHKCTASKDRKYPLLENNYGMLGHAVCDKFIRRSHS